MGIGTKFGISFTGKWVFNWKDYIDVNFMKLFKPFILFRDYEDYGTKYPLEKNELLL